MIGDAILDWCVEKYGFGFEIEHDLKMGYESDVVDVVSIKCLIACNRYHNNYVVCCWIYDKHDYVNVVDYRLNNVYKLFFSSPLFFDEFERVIDDIIAK